MSASGWGLVKGGTYITLRAYGSPNVDVLALRNTHVSFGVPVLGEASPYGVHGQLIKAMADTNQTLADTEYCYGIVRCTGALTADRTLAFPAPADDASAYTKIVDNQCSGSNLVVSTGAGATVTMTPGTSALLIFDDTVGVREAVV